MFPQARGDDLAFTPEELQPALDRLREAVSIDLERGAGTPQQRVAAAWKRIAELRLPRTVIPNAVLDELERLIATWDSHRPPGGMSKAAFSLTPAECEAAAERIRWMLHTVEEAARNAAA